MGAELKYIAKQVVLQEIPGEICLSFLITGCQLQCKGCHSTDSWDASKGISLTPESLQAAITPYQRLLSCVLFMGGDWQTDHLLKLLDVCQNNRLKTALYTGEEHCSDLLLPQLNYLKTGPWVSSLGGLNNPDSNQRLINLDTGECLNHYFWH